MEQAKEQVEKGQGSAALLPKKRKRKKKWLKRALVLALAVLFLAGAALFLLSRGGGAPGEILQEMTAKVERGTVNRIPSRGQRKNIKDSRPAARGLLATFYAARDNLCFSIGVRTPKLRCTLLVL